MGFWSRAKQFFGAEAPVELTATATTVLNDRYSVFILDGATVTITSLVGNSILPGRRVTFLGKTGASAITFTNTNGASAEGTMDLGGSNVTFAADDVLELIQKSDGSWRRVVSTDN